MSFTSVMFCPGCGEKNEETAPYCIKCGLDLARLRLIIADCRQDVRVSAMENTNSENENFSNDRSTSNDFPGEPTPRDTGVTEPGEPEGFDISDPIQWKDRGNDFFRDEKFLDALDCYEKALAIDQFYKEAWCNKSIVLKKIGRNDQSKVCWGIYKRLCSGETKD
jgi:hypothetical protein